MRDELVRGTRISIALDANDRSALHCHHEKLVIVDDRVAFVGGIDLTTFAGDRLDTSEHPPRDGVGWHDTCLRLEGPIVADVARHFLLRWRAIATDHTGEPGAERAARRAASRRAARSHRARAALRRVREAASSRSSRATCARSGRRSGSSTSRASSSGRRRSPPILAEKLRDPPRDDFRVLVLLPSRPNNGADDTRGQLGVLIDADSEAGDDRTRFLACTLYQPGHGGRPVYVHSKTAVVDDAWLTVGSANLNEHSVFNDTEVNVVLHDPRPRARDTAAALVGAPRAAGGGDRRRPGAGLRRGVEAARARAARPPPPRGLVAAPARAAAAGLAACERDPRPVERARRRRLRSAGRPSLDLPGAVADQLDPAAAGVDARRLEVGAADHHVEVRRRPVEVPRRLLRAASLPKPWPKAMCAAAFSSSSVLK